MISDIKNAVNLATDSSKDTVKNPTGL